MKIVKRTLGWLPRPSLYQETVVKRAKWKDAHASYLSANSSLTSTISALNLNQSIETGNITARVAKARILSKIA